MYFTHIEVGKCLKWSCSKINSERHRGWAIINDRISDNGKCKFTQTRTLPRNDNASVIVRQPTEVAHHPGKHQRRHFLRRSTLQAHASSTHHTRTSQYHIRTSHVSRSHPLHGPVQTTAKVDLKQLHTPYPSRRQRHSQLTPMGDQSNGR